MQLLTKFLFLWLVLNKNKSFIETVEEVSLINELDRDFGLKNMCVQNLVKIYFGRYRGQTQKKMVFSLCLRKRTPLVSLAHSILFNSESGKYQERNVDRERERDGERWFSIQSRRSINVFVGDRSRNSSSNTFPHSSVSALFYKWIFLS